MFKTVSRAFPHEFRTPRPEPEGPNGDKRSQSHAGNLTITKLPDEILLGYIRFLSIDLQALLLSRKGLEQQQRVVQARSCVPQLVMHRLVILNPIAVADLLYGLSTPTRAAILTRPRLASLPIVVDYFHLNRTPGPPQRLASAMSYPNRVCGIVVELRGAISFDRIFKALDPYFPALESLEIYNKRPNSEFDLPLPPTFLTTRHEVAATT
jgi:hypothetical protein